MKLSYTILYVESVQAAVKFYQNAFGIEHRFTHDSGDYAEMNTGETTLAFCNHQLADSILKGPHFKASLSGPAPSSQITFCPNDIKQAFEKALNNGAKSISEPEVKPWNYEVAILKDCDGHIVELAKKLP